MEKSKIETFIKKYNLGGAIDSAIWTNSGDDLNVTTMTSDKKLFASVQLKDGAKGFINGVQVGVMTTDKLKKMLAPLSADISLSLDVDENDATRVRQVICDDGKFNFNYVAQETSTMDAIPKMKNIPNFDVEITLTPEFVEAYFKAFAAVSTDQALFTLVMNKKKKKLELVLGYKQILSDRIAMEVTAAAGKDAVKNPISFNAKLLKEILSANSDVDNPVLNVSEAGLASIAFEKEGVKSQYYLVKIDVED